MSELKGRFLVVEDEPLVAKGLMRLIARRGFGECVLAGTADDALRYLSDGSHISALVIDIGLPDGSGLDVLARARREAHALTPALMLSGSNDRDHVNCATTLDARYMIKPVDLTTLALFLEDAISLARRLTIALSQLRLSDSLSDIVSTIASVPEQARQSAARFWLSRAVAERASGQPERELSCNGEPDGCKGICVVTFRPRATARRGYLPRRPRGENAACALR